jgi:hypothetical protein
VLNFSLTIVWLSWILIQLWGLWRHARVSRAIFWLVDRPDLEVWMSNWNSRACPNETFHFGLNSLELTTRRSENLPLQFKHERRVSRRSDERAHHSFKKQKSLSDRSWNMGLLLCSFLDSHRSCPCNNLFLGKSRNNSLRARIR